MDRLTKNRAKACILGALVADAATMGLHWVYSQKRILEVAPEAPEFRTPDEADYAGGVGYFAHAGKVAGDFSHYGEQMLVMLESLLESGGSLDEAYQVDQSAYSGLDTFFELSRRNAGRIFRAMEFE